MLVGEKCPGKIDYLLRELYRTHTNTHTHTRTHKHIVSAGRSQTFLLLNLEIDILTYSMVQSPS